MITLTEIHKKGAKYNAHVESVFTYCEHCKMYTYRHTYNLKDKLGNREISICTKCEKSHAHEKL